MAQETTTTITTLTYNGPAPYPMRPVTDPTPDEQYEQYMQQQEQLRAAREAESQQSGAKEGGGSALGKFSMLAKGVANNLSKNATQLHNTVEAKMRAEVQARDKKRWETNFPDQVSAGEKWICDYSCKVMHAGQQFSGNLILSDRHLSFLGNRLKDSIPLTDIVSIQRSVVLPTVSNGPPFILPVPAEHVIASCLQIFTTKNQVYQFLEFSNTATNIGGQMTASIKGTAIERAYNFLDHAWRAAGPVPKPGVNYQPPQM
eukprot:Sspe_Gene.65130::Locus_38566_Transcript_1_4_Confidence_0.500_Length_920::g.65130::m.65130